MKFFDPNYTLKTPQKWILTLNHLYFLLVVFALWILWYFIAPSKNKLAIKINKIFLGSFLFVLETGRIIYRGYCEVVWNGSLANFDVISAISFQMCAIMTWFTIISLFLSAFLKKDNPIFKYLYNIMFGCAMPGAFLPIICPNIISPNYPIWHFKNVQTILVHMLLVFIPIYLIKIREFRPDFRNFWTLNVGYCLVGSESMMMSLVSGHNFTIARQMEFEFLKDFPFPYHLPLSFLTMLLYAALVYWIAIKLINIRDKNELIVTNVLTKKERNFIFIKTIFTLVCIAMYLAIAGIIGQWTTSIYGILCFLPFIFNFFGLLVIEIVERKNSNFNSI